MNTVLILLTIINIGLFIWAYSYYKRALRILAANRKTLKHQKLVGVAQVGLMGLDWYLTQKKEKEKCHMEQL